MSAGMGTAIVPSLTTRAAEISPLLLGSLASDGTSSGARDGEPIISNTEPGVAPSEGAVPGARKPRRRRSVAQKTAKARFADSTLARANHGTVTIAIKWRRQPPVADSDMTYAGALEPILASTQFNRTSPKFAGN